MLAAVCSTEIFTQRYCRCNNDKEIKLISVTLMWQQIIHGSIRSHFHSTTQRQRIPWSMAVNGSLYQPLWKACLITHSNTTVPRVVDFPNGHWFTDQRRTVLRVHLFFNAQGADAVVLQVCRIVFYRETRSGKTFWDKKKKKKVNMGLIFFFNAVFCV